jgi:hypothetical protein
MFSLAMSFDAWTVFMDQFSVIAELLGTVASVLRKMAYSDGGSLEDLLGAAHDIERAASTVAGHANSQLEVAPSSGMHE